MKSNEYWEGYHSYAKGLAAEECPYRFEPASAHEWRRGLAQAASEAAKKSQ
ncbi:hypothetical protein [Pseudomonas antarctica]|uniref:hypothetical protein n=1 Tax=Pseudomonas antarctica TaxID=219572 RepID=UPI00387B4F36